MEAKLKEYRALRRRKELIENAKEKLEQTKNKIADLFVPKIFSDMNNQKEDEVLLIEKEEPPHFHPPVEIEDPSEVASEISELESFEGDNESWRHSIIKWSIYAILWLILYAIFLKLQFGAVFFVISLLVGICINTRTGPRKRGEVSAYSVFNQDCVSINGTLKAEQFEREIRYGAQSVR